MINVRPTPKADICIAPAHVRIGPVADIRARHSKWPRGALDPHVDLAAQRAKVNRLGEGRLSTGLQGLAVGFRIAIRRDRGGF